MEDGKILVVGKTKIGDNEVDVMVNFPDFQGTEKQREGLEKLDRFPTVTTKIKIPKIGDNEIEIIKKYLELELTEEDEKLRTELLREVPQPFTVFGKCDKNDITLEMCRP